MSWKTGLGAALSSYAEGLSGYRQNKAQEQSDLAKAALDEISRNMETEKFQLLKDKFGLEREEFDWKKELEGKKLKNRGGGTTVAGDYQYYYVDPKTGKTSLNPRGQLLYDKITSATKGYFANPDATTQPDLAKKQNEVILSDLINDPEVEKLLYESEAVNFSSPFSNSLSTEYSSRKAPKADVEGFIGGGSESLGLSSIPESEKTRIDRIITSEETRSGNTYTDAEYRKRALELMKGKR